MYKKNLLVCLLAILMASSAMAQSKIGVQAGLNLSNYWGKDSPESSMKPGFQIGLVTERYEPDSDSKLRNFSYQTGILFSQMGGKTTDLGMNTEMTINYLQIPINVRYNLEFGGGMGVYVQAGPYIGYAISGSQKTEKGGTWESEKVNFGDRNMERFDFGLGLGAGLRIMNNIQLGASYNWGFYSLVKNSTNYANFYNSHLAITLTCLFGK